MLAKVFPKLTKVTYNLQVIDHLAVKRLENYQREFINEVRRKILMKKI